MKCQFCGKEIPEQSKFCRHCGARQISVVPGHSGREPKKNRGIAAAVWVAAVLAILALIAVGVFFLFRGFTDGGSGAGTAESDRGSRREEQRDQEEDDEHEEDDRNKDGEEEDERESEGSSQSKKRSGNKVLDSYLVYIGTRFTDLPEPFERETVTEGEGFSVIEAREAVRYGGMDGTVVIQGTEFSDQDLRETIGVPDEIGAVFWQPDAAGQDELEKILEQMTEDYGDYDGSVIQREIEDRASGNRVGEYTLYYWDNPGNDSYDVQLLCLDDECFAGLSACTGEDDSRYLKPLEEMTEAFKNGDVDALEDVLAEEDGYEWKEEWESSVQVRFPEGMVPRFVKERKIL